MQDIHDIKPLIDVGIGDTRLPLVLLILVVAGLVFIGYTIRERRVRQKNELSVPQEAHTIDRSTIIEAARSRIEEAKVTVDTKDFKQTYIDITSITKECVSEVYAVPLQSLTTSEISRIQQLPPEVTQAIIHFLRNVDHLKFDNVLSERDRAIALCNEAEDVLGVITKNIGAERDAIDSKKFDTESV